MFVLLRRPFASVLGEVASVPYLVSQCSHPPQAPQLARETKLFVCNERLEVPQAGGDMADRHIRYVGTMAMQSTAWSPIEMDGVLMSDQDVRYFHFGIEIHVLL